MTITPFAGPMKPGGERFCGNCELQLIISERVEGGCGVNWEKVSAADVTLAVKHGSVRVSLPVLGVL